MRREAVHLPDGTVATADKLEVWTRVGDVWTSDLTGQEVRSNTMAWALYYSGQDWMCGYLSNTARLPA